MSAMMPTAPARPNTAENFVRSVIEIAEKPAEFKQRLDAIEAARKALQEQTETHIVNAQKAEAAQTEANVAWRKAEGKLHELAERTDASKAELERLKAKHAEKVHAEQFALEKIETALKEREQAHSKESNHLTAALAGLALEKGAHEAASKDLSVREAKLAEREARVAVREREHTAKVKSISDALSGVHR